MTLIALVGDHATTTSVALAATWPHGERVTVVEADPHGGSLAAWLDTPSTPSLSTIVANPDVLVDDLQPHDRANSSAGLGVGFDNMIQLSKSGIRFIAAPTRSIEARRAVTEATNTLFPVVEARHDVTMIADLGRWSAADGVPPIARLAQTVVLCHAQRDVSAAAAAVRLDRLAEQVAVLEAGTANLVLAVIGDHPFDLDEIVRFVSDDGAIAVTAHSLADDALTAAVFAGRTGVSQRRVARLPLMRTARQLASTLHRLVPAATRPDPAATERRADLAVTR